MRSVRKTRSLVGSTLFAAAFGGAALLSGCGGADGASDATGDDAGPNPFLAEQTSGDGKSDTAYLNPDGIEVEVDFEADVEADAYQLADGPANVAQFALTYLRKRGEFYLESLAEDQTSDSRVEWLVDGNWVTAADARGLDRSKLRHFRIRGMNAVMLDSIARGAAVGKVFTAKVPVNPYNVMSAAQNTCAEEDGHITLSQSVYWYMWDPDKAGCKVTPQEAKLTISKVLPARRTTYPEYDQLAADGKVTAVVLFGLIGDDLVETDVGFTGLKRMARWLGEAGFREVTPAPVGRRFTKHLGEVDFEIDLYSPREFSGLSDYAHFSNFERAVTEHEIVAYDGHSMLGASDFWARPKYPAGYQMFLYGGCLGYEYYVRPIVAGKDGWANLDIMSSVIEVTAGANEFAGPVLAKLAFAFEHGYKVSWKDLLVAVRQRVGDSTFGASGVRDNCFNPGGESFCSSTEPVGGGASGEMARFASTERVDVPDNAPAGVTSVLAVSDTRSVTSVRLSVDIAHPWAGDLVVSLSHGGVTKTVWDKAGGQQKDLRQSFELDAFAGQPANGDWTLTVIDTAREDVGALEGWSLELLP